MDTYQFIMVCAVVAIFGGSVFGIFTTKTEGFGKYTVSALSITLVLFVAALAFVLGKVAWTPLGNLLFAVVGFAGGLVTGGSLNNSK
jgi:uncharacterized protein YebE (UPF0316 family)